jgi:proteasome lid subunit RPN8/RPN11
MFVAIDPELEAELRDHARAAFPREACGLLGRAPDPTVIRLVRYQRMANLAAATDRFEMDPIAVVQVEQQLRAAGLELGAVFHSHPGAPPAPSTADHAEAWPGLAQLILSVRWNGDDSGELTAWMRRGDRLRPLHPIGRCLA